MPEGHSGVCEIPEQVSRARRPKVPWDPWTRMRPPPARQQKGKQPPRPPPLLFRRTKATVAAAVAAKPKPSPQHHSTIGTAPATQPLPPPPPPPPLMTEVDGLKLRMSSKTKTGYAGVGQKGGSGQYMAYRYYSRGTVYAEIMVY